MDPIIWSIILFVSGLALLVLEVFIPSGGMFGFLSVTAIGTSIVMAFYNQGLAVGLVFMVLATVTVPMVLVLAFRYWPQTPMGKRVLLDNPTSQEVLPDSPQRQRLRTLVGKEGVSKSLMLPSGAVSIEGLTVDATSEGTTIEPGQRVRVLGVQGMRVIVRPIQAESAAQNAQPPGADDPLSRPLESFGLEDPLA